MLVSSDRADIIYRYHKFIVRYNTYVSTDLFLALSFDRVLTWRGCSSALFRGNVPRSPITNASFLFFVDTKSHITNYAIIHNKPAVVVFVLNI